MTGPGRSSTTRHVIVLVVLSAACALGAYLVATGDRTETAASTTTGVPVTTTPSPELPFLGAYADADAARVALAQLDPMTLQPRAGDDAEAPSPPASDPAAPPSSSTPASTATPDGPTSTAPSAPTSAAATSIPRDEAVTERGRDRCLGAIVEQTPDDQIGELRTAGWVRINLRSFLVTAHERFETEARPAGTRLIVSDATSCRIEFAIDD